MQSAMEKVIRSFQVNQIKLRGGDRGDFFFIVLPGNDRRKIQGENRRENRAEEKSKSRERERMDEEYMGEMAVSPER